MFIRSAKTELDLWIHFPLSADVGDIIL